jgi:flagellar hook-associated protein 2
MTDLTSLDPQTLATQLAGYDILSLQNALSKQTSSLKSQQAALTALSTAMSTFRTALTDLNKTNNGMLQNTASTSVDGIATVTADSSAAKGTYNLFVKQLASANQVSYDNLSDDDINNATGTMSITINGESVDIEMDGLKNLADLSSAINNSEDNPGVTASLIRTDGQVSLMFSSDETGAKNVVEIDGSQMDSSSADKFAASNQETITAAADAIFRMGDSPKEYTNSSNTLDKLIEGVTIELTKKQDAGDAPLRLTIGTDPEETKTQVQSFVDAYNTLRSSLNTLTDSGSGSTNRGAYAGDAGIASLDRELNDILRTQFGGKDMTAFGITADKDGKLSIDSEKFNETLKADPTALTSVFNGNDGLIKKMDKSLDKYLNTSSGMLKSRQETLDRQQTEIDTKTDKINTRYETSYNRYLKQFTQLQSIMTQMNSTMSMFDLA